MKSYTIYLSDCKNVIVCADTWEKTEDSIFFKNGSKVVAVFNFYNVMGMCENNP